MNRTNCRVLFIKLISASVCCFQRFRFGGHVGFAIVSELSRVQRLG